MAGVYTLTYTTANTTLGTGITNTVVTNGAAASFFVSGSGAVVAATGIGSNTGVTAVIGGQAQIRFATAAHGNSATYTLLSSGVGSIQTMANGGATNATSFLGIAANADYSQGARVITPASTDTVAVIATVISAVAGTQTLTWTAIDATTGVPTTVATQVITWGASPTVVAGTSTARLTIPAANNATGTDDATAITRLATGESARIVVTLRDAAGNALFGPTVSATIAGSGLIRAFDGNGGGTGTARSTSIALGTSSNVASIGISADGTAGTGTVSILVGTAVVATKTVTFFGAPAAITVVQNHKILNSTAATVPANADLVSGPAATSIATTPAYILTVTDSNGVRIPGLTTANISAVSSDPTVVSSTIGLIENTTVGAGNTVLNTYNGQVTSVTKASGSTATLTFRVALGTTPETYVTSTPITYTLGGGVASVILGLDRTSYTPGQAASVSIAVRDSSGNPARDSDHTLILAGALSSNLGITGSLQFNAATASTVSSLGGVAIAKVNAPATGGTWTVSGTTGTGPSVVAEKSKAISVSATVTSETAGLLTQIDALNAKIVALNALIAKIMKKLGVK
jgi:hypothetical protein